MAGPLTIGRNPSEAELQNWRFQVTASLGGRVVGRVRTLDATPTTLMRLVPGVNKSMGATIEVIGRQIGGSAGSVGQVGAYLVYSAWKKISGALSLLGTQTPRVAFEDEPAWQVEVVSVTDTPTVQVTGAANMEITWTGTLQVIEVAV